MNVKTVRRIARQVAETPQRGPRTRDRRGRERQELRAMADDYRYGMTEDMDD